MSLNYFFHQPCGILALQIPQVWQKILIHVLYKTYINKLY